MKGGTAMKYKNFFDKFMQEYIDRLTDEYTSLIKVFPREYVKEVVKKHVQRFIDDYEEMHKEVVKIVEAWIDYNKSQKEILNNYNKYKEYKARMSKAVEKSETHGKLVNWYIWDELARNYVDNYMTEEERELWSKFYDLSCYHMDIVEDIVEGEVLSHIDYMIEACKKDSLKLNKNLKDEIKALERLASIYRERELQNQTEPTLK